jgi:hypothetical protein
MALDLSRINHPLLNPTTIREYLTREAAWSESHGASRDYLGMGLLYYTLVYIQKARVAVCLGSGGGFVPRLMRQAQRDLGISETSRTILVDGNVPSAGWGSPQWLAPDSLFRTRYPDIEIINDLTRNAALGFFTAQQLSIDYLHIDADHSFVGCFEDFSMFRPFLHEGAIVSLHDTNSSNPRAGVKQVIEQIRTFADCEVIDLPDAGEGTAVVRIGRLQDKDRRHAFPPSVEPGGALLQVGRTAEEQPPIQPTGKEWKYLESPAFATRYVLAAHFVRNCRTVVEIGGSKTPIDQFLEGSHDAILVIDPLISERHQETWQGQSCPVSYLRARFQDLEWTIPPEADFGLVMLGLEFQGMQPEHWQMLFQLIERARVTVIEFPMSWETSRVQFQMICANTRTQIVYRAGLELAGNNFGNLENSWPARTDRTFFVLEPQPRLDAAEPAQPVSVQAEMGGPAGPVVIRPFEAAVRRIEEPPTQMPPPTDGWQQALAGDETARNLWRSTGGQWQWQTDSVLVNPSGVEWSNLEWQPWNTTSDMENILISVTVSGSAEAAGLSFGPYKDFLTPLQSRKGVHRLQLEIDAGAQRWAFRVDGQLQERCWWDEGVHHPEDLLGGMLTLKARNAKQVRFQDLTVHRFASSAKLSVVLSCYRFARRLQVCLGNWCQSTLPSGALEVIVVNPQSPDGTHDLLAALAASHPGVRLHELQVSAAISRNKGAMINRAIAASMGEWIWLSDADCLFTPASAASVLKQVDGNLNTLFYGQRRHLGMERAETLLAGKLDSLAIFQDLASTPDPQPADNSPWGYTQIGHRSVFKRVRYSEALNHFDKSDDMFIDECRRQGISEYQLPGLFCLHLNHPFAWYGTDSFL